LVIRIITLCKGDTEFFKILSMASKITMDKYQSWLIELKERIRSRQQKAALLVNTELLELYWEMGKEIVEKQQESNWGDKIIAQLAKDLMAEFPGVGGFSATNLKYVRRWFQFYSTIGQQHVDQLPKGRKKKDIKTGQQPVDPILPGATPMPELLSRLPWGHHIRIITKCSTVEEAAFYVQEAIRNNWSRNVLSENISSQLIKRKGNAITNFEVTLPAAQSDLAREMLKNPYNFDFLTLDEAVNERELERALIGHIRKFMLELGRGFAYVGNQFNLKVEEDDFFLDLLFYNYLLDCFVIFELKVGEFKPEYAGKLNFYINAVDEQIKEKRHRPTIGVLLCKTPNKTVVQYSLKAIDSPIGVSDYEWKKALPKELKAGMPTSRELEQEVEKEVAIFKKPIDEKKQQLRQILSTIKGNELKKELDKEALFYIFKEVLRKIKENVEKILADEMNLFKHAAIVLSINNNTFTHATQTDLEAKMNAEKIQYLGLRTNFEGFKKAGTKAFEVYIELSITLNRFKYSIGEKKNEGWGDYLYDHIWKKEELMNLSEKWSEIVVDEISRLVQRLKDK
jgi:predicted nuclease of restriction endonuclease-like (RecB) superfamily